MKFKKLFSLSAIFVTAFVLPGTVLFTHSSDYDKKTKDACTVSCPDLKIKRDTLHINNQNISVLYKMSLAMFLAQTNTIKITYYKYDDDVKPHIKKVCNARNGAFRVYFRHEMEHARNANLTTNPTGLSRLDFARVAVMDEVASLCGEIIESQNYRLETRLRFPYPRSFLSRTDSMIMAHHNRNTDTNKNKAVDFSDSAIANIVLKCAVDKFAAVHNQRLYVKRVRNILRGIKTAPYTPNNQCRKNRAFFRPDFDMWGELLTYDVISPTYFNNRVDIWNSASKDARQYAISQINSIIQDDMLPGQMLKTENYQKIR